MNSLLTEIDAIADGEGVVLLRACNYPDKLDPALIRSSRMDNHIRIGLAKTDHLTGILREHLEGNLEGVDLSAIAAALSGLSGADCEPLVRGARRRARSVGRILEIADLFGELASFGGLSTEPGQGTPGTTADLGSYILG